MTRTHVPSGPAALRPHTPQPSSTRSALPVPVPARVPGSGRRLAPADVLALQRTAGNRAVLGMLDGGRTPPPVQRFVDTTPAREGNPYFAEAADVILGAIAAANGDLWRMINDDYWMVDLVFRSDLRFYEATGETRPMAFYTRDGRRARIEDLWAQGVELKDERITIELQVVPPVLSPWNRNAGEAAETVAHEYAIHAERFAKVIRHIRAEGNTGGGARTLVEWQREGEFDPDVHHASMFEPDQYTERFATLVNLMSERFLAAGMADHARNVENAFMRDVAEHRSQARFSRKRHRSRREVAAHRRERAFRRNREAIEEAIHLLLRQPMPSPDTLISIEDMIENL
jgi:hypothetical protein